MSKIIVRVAKNDNDFVGLKVKNDVINITFPIGYNIEENSYDSEKKIEFEKVSKDFNYLMKVLENTPISYYDAGEIKFNYSSAVKIMENYIKHGLYKEENDVAVLGDSGKINWKETMINVKPILWNHSMIYSEFYVYKCDDIDSIITEIQKYCINYIYKFFWWLYGEKEYIIFPKTDMRMKLDYMIYELNKKMHEINDDYSKKVINEMLLFLNGTKLVDISDNEEISIGRKFFNKIWERQLRIQLYSEFNKCDDAYPTTYYCFDGINKIVNNSLIPDIVFTVDNVLIIADAKYYMYGTYPKSSDICKQIFYEKYLRKKNKKIINLFILPGNIKEKFEIKGYALADGFDEDSKIELCYVDTKAVLKNKKAVIELIKKVIERNEYLRNV